jgi:hypothetical protein
MLQVGATGIEEEYLFTSTIMLILLLDSQVLSFILLLLYFLLYISCFSLCLFFLSMTFGVTPPSQLRMNTIQLRRHVEIVTLFSASRSHG